MMPQQPVQESPWTSMLGIAGQFAMNDPKSMDFLGNLFGGGGKSPFNTAGVPNLFPQKPIAEVGLNTGSRWMNNIYDSTKSVMPKW
jgi:hypothetical protein